MRISLRPVIGIPASLATCAVLILGGCAGGPSYEALFDTSPEAEGTGIMGVGLVRAVVIIATYEATERQRAVAEQRARLAHAKLLVATRRAPSQRSAPAKKKRAKKVARYLAVETARDTRSKGRASVMIWDTQSQEIVGNKVYDVQTPPPVLETGKFETYSAQYVASASF